MCGAGDAAILLAFVRCLVPAVNKQSFSMRHGDADCSEHPRGVRARGTCIHRDRIAVGTAARKRF